MYQENKKKTGKRWLWTGLIICAVIVAALGYWKRRGIRNTIYRILDLPAAINKEVYGYYGREADVKTDREELVSFRLEDSEADKIETDISKETSLVGSSYAIDEQLTKELENGSYTLKEPAVILNPYQISPLTGVVLFRTEEECRVRVTVKGKTDEADIAGVTAKSRAHRVPMVGLYPGTENQVTLELLDDEGSVLDETVITVQTDGLPEELRGMVSPVTVSGESAYGMTVVSGQSVHYPFAYDVNGDIRWYLSRQTASYGVFHLFNNYFIFQDKDGYIPSATKSYSTIMYEMDYLGRAVKMYFAPNGTHHEIIEKEPGGNLLILTSTLEDHIEDAIMEFDRETGEIVNSLKMTEVFGNAYTSKIDWAHLNTISYQADADTILISPRNLNSGVKLNWTTHEIVWILGNPRIWEGTKFEKYVLTPEEDFMWHYRQHTVYEVGTDLDGNPDTVEISLFDNHTPHSGSKKYYEESENSYLTVYAVNETEGTVSLLKQIPVKWSGVTSNTIYDAESGHIFGMCGSVEEEDGSVTGMTYEFEYEAEELLNQYFIKEKFYRAIEMTPDYAAMSLPMEKPENYITGSLRPAAAVKQAVSEPEKTLEEGLSFRLMSGILFAVMPNRTVSQIIFQGENAAYVYDLSYLKLYDEVYLQHTESIPIPLTGMEKGEYRIYCVYMDEYYDTGKSFTW